MTVHHSALEIEVILQYTHYQYRRNNSNLSRRSRKPRHNLFPKLSIHDLLFQNITHLLCKPAKFDNVPVARHHDL